MAEVREVQPEDFEALMPMAEAMHAEAPELQELKFSRGRTLETLVSVFETYRETVNGWVLEEDGEIIGALFGTVTDTFYSDDLVASDLVVYVKPEHRGGAKGVAGLIAAYQDWARERGAKIIYLGISTGVEAARTKRLYEFLGYRAVGPILKKN